MEVLAYLLRATLMLLVSWTALRIIGKKTIAQMTSYELVGLMLLTTVAAEPLVFKIGTKASIGTLFIALLVILISKLSLKKFFYNADMKTEIVIENGKLKRDVLERNKMNVQLLLSLLRLKGYAKISDVDYAIIETDGEISVLPKSTSRPVQPQDMQLSPPYEPLPLPLILEGEILYSNLRYANLTKEWLNAELEKADIKMPDEIFVAQLIGINQLYICKYSDMFECRK